MQNSALATNNSPQYLATDTNALYSPQPMGSSGIHKIVPETVTPSFEGLQCDVRQFVKVLLPNRSVNVVTSPLLVNTTEAITARVLNEAGLNGSAIGSGQTRPNIKNTVGGIHIQSKKEHVDKTLEQLQIPHTTSVELIQKGYARATAELNARIAEDTQGMITDFLDPRNLEDPALIFRLVTWLFQHVSWVEPFELMDDVDSSAMTWKNTTHPEIQWMKSSYHNNSVTHTNSEGYDFVAVPVEETGMKAVLVLPPPEDPNHNSEDLNRVLSNGLSSILGKTKNEEAKLTLPKLKFDYQFTTAYPEAGVIGTHNAALNINEKGADVAAASGMLAYECCYTPLKECLNFDFDRPFYLSIIDHQNDKEPRVAGMGWINQPWNS
ncbi:hypothetical protein J7438_21825 [Thalassotalea sp. G20_0]|uniref:serpin family protein n=1 Tax=Thalassotalea sp. G20_0 TaxID=2821093 RepID=UPI001ADB0F2A|nr:serpin family protein [Thalassotalea sp. G20_0]MBO9496702.1 hypothetical protein [Thalassotalea sp. G20_0]